MRKRKISIKLGHLLIGVAVIFFLFPLVIRGIGYTMIKMNGEFFGKSQRYYGAASLELYTKLPKLIPTTGKDYFDVGKAYYDVVENRFMYSPSGGSSGKVGNEERVYRAIENFKEGLAKGEDEVYYSENLSMIINSYTALGNIEEAKKYIELAKDSSDEKIKNTGLINDIILLAKEGKGKEALEYCRNNIINNEFRLLYINLLYNYGEIDEYNYELGKRLNEVKEERRKIAEKNNFPYSESKNDNYELFSEKDVNLLNNIDFRCSTSFKERNNGSNTLEGQIVKDGKPVKYQRVYVGQFDGAIYYMQRNVVYGELHRSAYTDENGYYKIENIPNGNYKFEIEFQGYLTDNGFLSLANEPNMEYGFNIDLNDKNRKLDFKINEYMSLKDKENFIEESSEWLTLNIPKVDGASKIGIELGHEYMVDYLISNIDGSWKIKIPLDNGSFLMKKFDYNEIYNNYGNEYIGNIPKSEIYISLKYFDKNGEVIKKTIPFEVKWTCNKKELNEGDKLMLQGEFDEAVKWYDDKIKEDGIKRRYLYPIIKYYGDYTWRNVEEYNKYYDMLKTIGLEEIEIEYLDNWGNL